jgi:hypothetical protein
VVRGAWDGATAVATAVVEGIYMIGAATACPERSRRVNVDDVMLQVCRVKSAFGGSRGYVKTPGYRRRFYVVDGRGVEPLTFTMSM